MQKQNKNFPLFSIRLDKHSLEKKQRALKCDWINVLTAQ
jgi:hypothetical protein